MLDSILTTIKNFIQNMGIAEIINDDNWWQYLVMYLISGILIYLAIAKKI